MRYAGMLGTAAPSVGVYDKTKISTFGRANLKTINTESVYGPGLTKFIDTQTPFGGLMPLSGVMAATDNNRLFVCSSLSTGLISIALYEFDQVTGAVTERGRIVATLPNQAATTAVPRLVQVIDTGTTGWKIFIGTVASVTLVNGGVFCVNKVDLVDFSFSVTPVQFFMAQSSDARGVYFLQDPTLIGVNHAMTTLIGGAIAPTVNQLLTSKGTAASLTQDGFSTNTAPTYASATASVVNAGVSTFTITAHGYLANDMLIILSAAPTGFTASGVSAVQTVYFVRNPTANTFELSATSGGASILGTSVTAPVIGRAFGTSTNLYVAARKTGVIATGFVGTALLINGNHIGTPAEGPNAGVVCFMLATTSNFYCWPITSITAAATSLLGNFGINNLGNGIDYVAPSTVHANYSDVLQKLVYVSSAFSFYARRWVNSAVDAAFGSQQVAWLENNSNQIAAYFRAFAVVGIEVKQGWMFAANTTIGQRGILMMDARSDASFGYTYMTSPVQDLSGTSVAAFISTIEQMFDVTDTVAIYYRTAATAGDAIFNSDSGGWTAAATAAELSAVLSRFVQVRVEWDVLSILSGNPTQVQDIILGYDLLTDMSEYWSGMATGTTDTSPSHTVYRQTKLFGSVPTWYHRGIDDSQNVVEFFNTVTDVAQFDYSTDDGVSYTPGVGPDQVGKRLRFTRVSPPGVILSVSLKES